MTWEQVSSPSLDLSCLLKREDDKLSQKYCEDWLSSRPCEHSTWHLVNPYWVISTIIRHYPTPHATPFNTSLSLWTLLRLTGKDHLSSSVHTGFPPPSNDCWRLCPSALRQHCKFYSKDGKRTPTTYYFCIVASVNETAHGSSSLSTWGLLPTKSGEIKY